MRDKHAYYYSSLTDPPLQQQQTSIIIISYTPTTTQFGRKMAAAWRPRRDDRIRSRAQEERGGNWTVLLHERLLSVLFANALRSGFAQSWAEEGGAAAASRLQGSNLEEVVKLLQQRWHHAAQATHGSSLKQENPWKCITTWALTELSEWLTGKLTWLIVLMSSQLWCLNGFRALLHLSSSDGSDPLFPGKKHTQTPTQAVFVVVGTDVGTVLTS